MHGRGTGRLRAASHDPAVSFVRQVYAAVVALTAGRAVRCHLISAAVGAPPAAAHILHTGPRPLLARCAARGPLPALWPVAVSCTAGSLRRPRLAPAWPPAWRRRCLLRAGRRAAAVAVAGRPSHPAAAVAAVAAHPSRQGVAAAAAAHRMGCWRPAVAVAAAACRTEWPGLPAEAVAAAARRTAMRPGLLGAAVAVAVPPGLQDAVVAAAA